MKSWDVINVEVYLLIMFVPNVDIGGLKMGMSAVQYKVLPEGLETDLNILKDKVKVVIEEN